MLFTHVLEFAHETKTFQHIFLFIKGVHTMPSAAVRIRNIHKPFLRNPCCKQGG